MTRGQWGVRASVAVLALSSLGGASCHRHPPPDWATVDAAPVIDAAVTLTSDASADHPADMLGPGELVDGSFHAFELKLPLGVQINEAFTSVVYAQGQVDPMRLANYLRLQVRGGSISVGAAATVFDKVTSPKNPKRLLRIRVDSTGQGHSSRLEVRDVTPPPLEPAESEAERWKRAGLSPTGQILDPTHLH